MKNGKFLRKLVKRVETTNKILIAAVIILVVLIVLFILDNHACKEDSKLLRRLVSLLSLIEHRHFRV